MKTIFTLLLSTLFSLSLFAYDGARLTISSAGNNKMYVEVDGRRYDLGGNTVSIQDVHSGYHSVRVYREMKKSNGRGFGFGKGGNKNRQENIYNSRVYLKEGYHFDIMINRFGKVMADEHRIDPNDEWYNDDEDNYYDKDKGHGDDGDLDNNDRYDNDYIREMSNSDFTQAKESLRREWFENTRVTSVKQIIDRNSFTSQQVKEMLLLFTFENNRLDIAKYAYGKTVDKGNYFVVNDAFTFNNNKEELARFIREFR